jgi:hypothetical protein
MANKTLLTNLAKTSSVLQTYLAPESISILRNLPIVELYAFLAKVEPWDDENNPPNPIQDQKSLKQIFNNMFVVKKISTYDISPVAQRIDWTSGVTYEYYRDDADMTELDQNGLLVRKFYAMNRYYQVFKCLWNNNYSPATVEPYFEPGTYGTNNIFSGADGYKWKYLFTVDSGLRNKFMDKTWIPVFPNNPSPSALDTSAGSGNLDAINVLNGGFGYDPGNYPVTVVITGDGTASNGTPYTTATAVAVITAGVVKDIIVTDTGKNYTYANAFVSSIAGTGCILAANTVSPIGGHGNDNVSELGCSHVMLTVSFNGSENGFIPTDVDYRQLGLIANPYATSTYPNPANGAIYKTTTDLVVAAGQGLYLPDEIVWQGTSADPTQQNIDEAFFSAKVVSFDQTNNILHTVSVRGTPISNQPLFGQSRTVRTLLSSSYPDYVIQSGYITYIENTTGIQRSSDGIEQFKIVLGY